IIKAIEMRVREGREALQWRRLARHYDAVDVSLVIISQVCPDAAAGAYARITDLIGEDVDAVVCPTDSGAAFADFASGARREEADVFIGPHQRPTPGRDQGAASRIAETFHFDQAFVNHHASIAGRFDRDAELRATHQD